MDTKRRRVLLFFIAVMFIAASLACGPLGSADDGDSDGGSDSDSSGGSDGGSDGDSGGGSDGDSGDGSDDGSDGGSGGDIGEKTIEFDTEDELDSYTMTIIIRTEMPDGTLSPSDSTEISVVHGDPEKSHLIMSDSSGLAMMEMIQIGETLWMDMGDGNWIETPAEEGDTSTGYETADMFEGMEDMMTFAGTETVNGVSCDKYEVDGEIDMSSMGGGMSTFIGFIWVANENNLPAVVVRTRLTTTIEANDEAMVLVEERDLTNINQPITIEPPVTE